MSVNKQLNMQISNEEEILEPLKKLNLLDDFLFDVATVDLETCKIILELSLGIRIKKLSWREGQKVVHNLPGYRGIRMDFYAEAEDGTVFDVEMQKRNEGNIPKRTRFYQALVDSPMLKSGERGFDNLRPSVIIIICGFDLYGLGKYRYTFENRCEEEYSLTLGDECKKVILNTKGTNKDEVEPSLVDFLNYVENSNEEFVPTSSDERLKNLHDKIQQIKASVQIGVEYMKMEERDRLIREKAMQAGIEKGIESGQAQGEERMARLVLRLTQEKRFSDLERASKDEVYRRKLFEELNIENKEL